MAENDAFRRAVQAHLAVSDEDEYDAVWTLLEPIARDAPAKAVEIALSAVASAHASERAVATDLLGLVAGFHRPQRARVVRSLLEQSRTERDDDVQWSLAMASAHSRDVRTFPILARLTRSSDPDVRYQVAQAVGAIADADTKEEAVRLLRLLAADADESVRAKAVAALLDLTRIPN